MWNPYVLVLIFSVCLCDIHMYRGGLVYQQRKLDAKSCVPTKNLIKEQTHFISSYMSSLQTKKTRCQVMC